MTGSLLSQISALLLRYYYNDLRRNKSTIIREYIPVILSGTLLWILVGLGHNPDQLTGIMLLFFPIGINAYIRTFLFDVVNEKAERYKEYLKISGTSELAYSLSIYIYGYIRMFLNSLVMLIFILICSSYLITKGHNITFELWIAYVCYSLLTVNFLTVYATFFSTPKLCSDTGGILTAFGGMLFFLIADEDKPLLYYIGDILPQIWINTALNTMADSNMQLNAIYDSSTSWIVFIVLFFAYIVLYAYLENVLPNEFGIRKSACFCCKRKRRVTQSMRISAFKQPNIQNQINDPLVNNESLAVLDENDQDFSSARYHQRFDNALDAQPSLQIRSLFKKFGNFMAVQNLSLTIYEKQIFCLLGHNGAGKTTTINMLTGILGSDAGKITYDGLDFKEDFDDIRSRIGLCAQKDILYPNMSVEEHLRMIATIRGVPANEMEQAIEQTIITVGLNNERGKFSSTLSGGNKRKLCLGMAIIGNVKFIFLDEPTSGMDPNSRRVVWDILRQLKNDGKTILLTTHYLDEADELADRIGIMTKGQLLALGTSDFIKKQFGEGYHIVIIPKTNVTLSVFNQSKERIDQIMKMYIKNAQKDEQTPPEVVKYALPFAYQSVFANLFQELENDTNITISLEMNTLEDAFIKIGIEEDKLLGNESSDHTAIDTPIQVPASIKKNPEYKFLDQLSAIILRKFYCTIRSPQAIIMTSLPILFLLLGAVIAKAVFNGMTSGDNDNEDLTHLTAYCLAYGFYASFVVLAFSLNSSIYCGFPVMEREVKLRYALKVMGCRKTPYWLGTFLFDYAFVMILIVFCIIFDSIEEVPLLKPYLGEYFVMMIFFVADVLGCAYFYGFMFTQSSTAYKSYGVFAYFVLYFFPYIILQFFVNFHSGELNQTKYLYPIKIIALIFGPFIAVEDGLLNLVSGSPELYGIKLSNQLLGQPLFSDWFYYPIVFAIRAIIFVSLAIYLEGRKYNIGTEKKNIIPQLIDFADQMSIDAKEINSETTRVSNDDCSDPIKIVNLSKTYPNGFQAVRDVSFGVEKGQILGLLGPNGAGKSTTFNILTALIPRTQGSVKLNNTEIDNDLAHIFKEVGICPQFDCLWEMLTVKEHLELFGRIKGLHGEELRENIDYYIRVMTLTDHINKKSKVLSGGNKRKLCVTNSLIGSPSLQFFDEPSTGLDPVARRALWTTITQNLQYRNAAIILTTHSMPEAESLCHKIGILINGRLVCFGSTPYLKNKYGNGYKITIRKDKKSETNTDNLIIQIGQNITKLPSASEQLITYQVSTEGFSFSKAFATLELFKKQGLITDFSIYNTTLEQVFIGFSKYQYVADDRK